MTDHREQHPDEGQQGTWAKISARRLHYMRYGAKATGKRRITIAQELFEQVMALIDQGRVPLSEASLGIEMVTDELSERSARH